VPCRLVRTMPVLAKLVTYIYIYVCIYVCIYVHSYILIFSDDHYNTSKLIKTVKKPKPSCALFATHKLNCMISS